VNHKTHMACNFNCLVETEQVLNVTGSYLCCTNGNIPEAVQDRDIVTNRKRLMASGITAVVMDFNDLHGPSPTASLFKCYFLYSCVAVDQISTDNTLCDSSVLAELLISCFAL